MREMNLVIKVDVPSFSCGIWETLSVESRTELGSQAVRQFLVTASPENIRV